MGGKALNKYGVHTDRKNTEEFLGIGHLLQNRLLTELFISTAIVTCYHTKADHGDLDLLIKMTPNLNINWKDYIQNTFKPQAINSNGGVYSFDFDGFQIDFIPIAEDKWEVANVYYSYDPLGNIMGKTFHKFGLSYGWDGLFYKYRNFNGKNSQNILLTTEAKKIFDFGGYDYDRYLKGFNTLEEIFLFCIDSKYFDIEIFQMENLKSIDKKRNRKRGSYHLFLNYIKEKGITTKYIFEEDKNNYLENINNYFPEAELSWKINKLRKIDETNKSLAEKFNGNVIMQWLPDLNGKELGNVIGGFKLYLGDYYNNFITESNIKEIKVGFMKFYNKFNGRK
jgi:hypothetical protein